MLTVAEKIGHAAKALLDGIATLVGPDRPLRDINRPSSSVVFIGPHYAFDDLSLDQKRLQSRLLEDHRHFIALVRSLLRTQPDEVLSKIEQHDKTICEAIKQTHCVWHSTTGKLMAAVRQAVDELLDALSCLYDPTEGAVVLVPDTNALLRSPAFQHWAFEGITRFELLLVPAILSELDSIKVEHRNPEVREKAKAVIRQIKEYRRRGSLSEGVDVVVDRIRLRAMAAEPQVNQALPWLDAHSSDDRMLASCVEAMRLHPRSRVALVTADINLQTKAEFARLPILEPPDVQDGV